MNETHLPNLKVHSDQEEQYTHGHDSSITRTLVASRTAATHASFFLPYLQPGMSLLDCGCGPGGITLGLAEKVVPGLVTGIDRAIVEIERAQQQAAELEVKNVRFNVGNIYQLEFPDRSFDAVFAHNVLEHVENPDKALCEMWRVLKVGGVIGIRDVDRGGDLLYPEGELLHQLLSLIQELWRKAGGHPTIGRRLRGLLHEVGFSQVKATASYEYYGDPAALQFISQIGVSRCSEPDFVEQVLQHRLATREQLEQIRAAWLTWPKHPAAFLAGSHCEAVAWKV